MASPRCPGLDIRHWKPEDILEIRCPRCGGKIEFFKDDPCRSCPSCGDVVRNPKLDLGCAKWCKFATECVGKAETGDASDAGDFVAH